MTSPLSPTDAARLVATLRRLAPDKREDIASIMEEAAGAIERQQAELARLRAPTGDAMEAAHGIIHRWLMETPNPPNPRSVVDWRDLEIRIATTITAAEARGRQAERERLSDLDKRRWEINNDNSHPGVIVERLLATHRNFTYMYEKVGLQLGDG